MNRKAIIFGIKGHSLSKQEKYLFKKTKPWGIILFKRNINDIKQLKFLVKEVKNLFNDKKFPILIDQEGGVVSRLDKIINFKFFSQNFFGKLYNQDKKLFNKVYKIYINSICEIFNNVGININTLPVLDVKNNKQNNFIGSRSFSNNPRIVTLLGNKCIGLHNKNKIGTVIKHIPGHGNSSIDSHKKTPVISSKKSILIKNDFKPFLSCKAMFAMTAHIIYSSYDKLNTATHSRKIIRNVIRGDINFKGILISDDISMKALKYNYKKNAMKALNSGCNLVLHCNGNIREMQQLSKIIPTIDNFTKKKTSDFYKFLR